MIVELTLAVASGAGAFLLWRRRRRRSSNRLGRAAAGSSASGESSSTSRIAAGSAPRGLLDEGEVIGIGDTEYWLTDAYWLYEDTQSVAAVYRAEDRQLVVVSASPPRVYLGHALPLELAPEFPALLEVEMQGFSLRSRIPVRVQASATSEVLPGRWARYEGGADEVLWILGLADRNLCLLTRRVPERLIFRWGRVSSSDTAGE